MSASFGYTLSSEEHPPADLVRNAVRAEEAGFDFLTVSDHFHPWVERQGHSPFVWSVLGAVASLTDRIPVATGVTCPTFRTHPAIVAHATATAALLFDGRFSLGVGSGEALNEHILGDRWPAAPIRLAMLEEAVGVIRQLLGGETVDHLGEFYEVENARLFDVPETPVPIIVSGFGPAATDLAGRIGDGYWGHGGDEGMIERFEAAGGHGPRYAQLNVCLGDDEAACRRTVHEVWPNGAVPGQLSQDLPTWTHFEQAAGLVTEDDAVSSVVCGPDIDAVVEEARSFVASGFDHIHLHQIGGDQGALFDRWDGGLRKALEQL